MTAEPYVCTITTPHNHSSFDDPIDCALRPDRWKPYVDEQTLRQRIAAEIAAHADDDSDVSDAYRHAALIATQGENR